MGFTPSAFRSELNCVYTALAHCQLTVTPLRLLTKRPDHLTPWMPPGKPPAGTTNGTPTMNSFPAVFSGVTVCHMPVLVLNEVVAWLADGEYMIVPGATGTL